MPDTFAAFARTTIVTEGAMFLVPALLMTFLLTSSPRQTLLLRWPRWFTIPAAMLLAVALHPAANLVQTIVLRLYPLGEEMQGVMAKMAELIHQADFWPAVLVIALLPAVCEELACRGFILSGFRHLGHKWRAIVYTAVVFGLAHTIIQQSVMATLVGVVIGYMAVQSGSLLPGVAFHLVNNTLVVATARITPAMLDQWPLAKLFVTPGDGGGIAFTWLAVGGGVVLGLLLLGLFAMIPCPKSPEESLAEAIERGQHSDLPLDADQTACGAVADR